MIDRISGGYPALTAPEAGVRGSLGPIGEWGEDLFLAYSEEEAQLLIEEMRARDLAALEEVTDEASLG